MKDKKMPRQIASEKLLAVYAELAPSKRDLLQETLLRHAFLSNGEAYIEWADGNECYRGASCIGLMEDVSLDAAHAWFVWAAEISTESSSVGIVREIVLEFVGELVSFRFLERFQSQATGQVGLEAPHFRLSDPSRPVLLRGTHVLRKSSIKPLV